MQTGVCCLSSLPPFSHGFAFLPWASQPRTHSNPLIGLDGPRVRIDVQHIVVVIILLVTRPPPPRHRPPRLSHNPSSPTHRRRLLSFRLLAQLPATHTLVAPHRRRRRRHHNAAVLPHRRGGVAGLLHDTRARATLGQRQVAITREFLRALEAAQLAPPAARDAVHAKAREQDEDREEQSRDHQRDDGADDTRDGGAERAATAAGAVAARGGGAVSAGDGVGEGRAEDAVGVAGGAPVGDGADAEGLHAVDEVVERDERLGGRAGEEWVGD